MASKKEIYTKKVVFEQVNFDELKTTLKANGMSEGEANNEVIEFKQAVYLRDKYRGSLNKGELTKLDKALAEYMADPNLDNYKAYKFALNPAQARNSWSHETGLMLLGAGLMAASLAAGPAAPAVALIGAAFLVAGLVNFLIRKLLLETADPEKPPSMIMRLMNGVYERLVKPFVELLVTLAKPLVWLVSILFIAAVFTAQATAQATAKVALTAGKMAVGAVSTALGSLGNTDQKSKSPVKTNVTNPPANMETIPSATQNSSDLSPTG